LALGSAFGAAFFFYEDWADGIFVVVVVVVVVVDVGVLVEVDVSSAGTIFDSHLKGGEGSCCMPGGWGS